MYDASSIQVLEGLEALRKRPGMYIGELGSMGLSTLVTSVVSHYLVSHRAGETSAIDICIEGQRADAPVRIRRDGPGDSLVREGERSSLLELLLTRISHWRPVQERRFGFPADIRWGHELPAVLALSDTLEAEVSDGHERRRVRGGRGHLWGHPELVGVSADPSMTLRYRADREIFGDATYDVTLLRRRLEPIAAFYPALTLVLQGEPIGCGEGIRALHTGALRHGPFEAHAFRDGVFVSSSLGWRADEAPPSLRCLIEYDGSREVREGAPIDGFHSGLLEALRAHVRADLPASDVRGGWGLGLDAVLHLRLDEPRLTGSTRQRLEGAELERRVHQHTRDMLAGAMARDPHFHGWLRRELSPERHT